MDFSPVKVYISKASNILERLPAKIALGLFVAALILSVSVNGWLKKVDQAQMQVHKAWVIIKQKTEQRLALVSELEKILATYAPDALSLKNSLAQIYKQGKDFKPEEGLLEDAKTAQAYSQWQNTFSQNIAQAQTAMASVPTVAQNQAYFMIKMQIHTLEEQIYASSKALNLEIENYNRELIGPFQHFANTVFGHRPLKYVLSFTPPSEEVH